ncbi:MAG: hypothetical protein QXX51_00310 [Candidatus Bathyarchaeia archaeon]
MKKPELDPRIVQKIKRKGKISEKTIRPAISKIRGDNPSLTLNAAAEIFAKKHGFSVSRYLNDKDRDALKSLQIEKIKVPVGKPKSRKKIAIIANYDTTDPLLKAHIDEINKTYTYGCYTATFILCRKVLENLIVHHILRKKYPENSEQHRSKYFDFNRNRNLDFNKLLTNLRESSKDFGPEKSLVERICQLAERFKEEANEMTHSLYHIATKKEIDEIRFQYILDLIKKLERTLS